MSATPPPEPRPFGELLGDALTLSRDGLAGHAAIIAAGLLPAAFCSWLLLAAGGAAPDAAILDDAGGGPQNLASLASSAIRMLADALIYAALVGSLSARDAGQPIRPLEAYGFAFEQLVPFALSLLRAIFWTLAGLLLLVVPGLVAMLRYSLVPMAVLLEGRRGADALARSSQLVRPHWPKVLGNLLGAGLIALFLSALIAAGFAVFTAVAVALTDSGVSLLERWTLELLTQLAGALVGVWAIAVGVLLYRDLAALHPKGPIAPRSKA